MKKIIVANIIHIRKVIKMKDDKKYVEHIEKTIKACVEEFNKAYELLEDKSYDELLCIKMVAMFLLNEYE